MRTVTRRVVDVNLIPALNQETSTPTPACSSLYEFERMPDPHATLDYRTSPVYNFTVSFVDDTKLGLKVRKKVNVCSQRFFSKDTFFSGFLN